MAAHQRLRALLGEGGAQLKIALLAEAELDGGLDRPQAFALALDEHCQLARNFIVGTDLQRSAGADHRQPATSLDGQMAQSPAAANTMTASSVKADGFRPTMS